MELIRPMKQSVWRWPAVVNFTLGGMGAGFYLLSLAATPIPDEPTLRGLLLLPLSEYLAQAALFKLLGPLLAALGFLALVTEAGRPLRGYNLFRHLRRSWMSRETLAASIFIPAAGLDWLYPHPVLKAIAALGAFGLMLSQGFIVYRARGVTAWNVPNMPPYFIVSGFVAGSGLLLACLSLSVQRANAALITWVLLILLAGTALWLAYLRRGDTAFQKATATLRTAPSLALTIGAGQVLPAMLLAWNLVAEPQVAAPQSLFLLLSGLCLIAGSGMQKWGIIIQAGYLRGIVLPMSYPVAVERSADNPTRR